MHSIDPITKQGNDWQSSAILHVSPTEYQAFICSPRGSYCIGTFDTLPDAQDAITDAEQARWNG